MKIVTKKRAAAAAAALVLAGGTMAAYAYFTGGSASTTGTAHTGSVSTWSVSVGTFAGGPVYPGSGTDSATYTITNTGNGNQALTSVAATVNAGTGGAVTQSGTAVPGCLATWYTATAGAPTPALNTAIAKNATATGTVSVTLTESNSSQNPCKGIDPDININVS
ncbi:MAG: hypothetical protein JOZ04_00935 [Acidimicrobiia bacterium]|nr:hypothetical protein [Acidimicrobiia bacterium]